MSHAWIPKNFNQVCKRAAGRRRYHARRRRRRDARQLLVMEALLKLGWKSYGAGRVLAKALSVDAATISRDIRYIQNWRDSLIKQPNMSASFADAII